MALPEGKPLGMPDGRPLPEGKAPIDDDDAMLEEFAGMPLLVGMAVVLAL